jgi:hypothetical protein
MNLGSILLKKAQARAKRERRERREIWRAEREARWKAEKPNMLVAKALVILHQKLNFVAQFNAEIDRFVDGYAEPAVSNIVATVERDVRGICLPVTYTVHPGPTLTINTPQEE